MSDSSYPKVNFNYLLDNWLREEGVNFWVIDDDGHWLIDTMWFKPKRSFDEFVHDYLKLHSSPTTTKEVE